MTNRWFNAGVFVFWVAAMSWLLTQKVLPPLMTGEPPDYNVAVVVDETKPPPLPVCWRLEWNGQRIGTAASQPFATADGIELRNVVRFQRLPLKDLLGQLLGPMAPLLNLSLSSDDFTPTLHVATRMELDEDQQLDRFRTVVDMPDLPRFIDLHGRMRSPGKLLLIATARVGGAGIDGDPPPQVRHRHEIDLPPDSLVGDSLSPRAELRNLHVGQQWTIPVYRPFPPNSPVQILLARVKKSEFIEHGGELIETLVVTYHDEAGSGIGSARTPIGRTWVQPDGTVLRQQVQISNLKLTFHRLSPGESTEAEGWLKDEAFEQHFVGLDD